MSYVINIDPFYAPDGSQYNIEITIPDGGYSVEESHHLTEFDTFQIGSSNYNEVIFYPSNFKFTFTVTVDNDRFDKWLLIYKLLTSNETTVNIQKDGVDYFWGNVYPRGITGNKDSYEIGLTVIDPITELKYVDNKTDFPGIPVGDSDVMHFRSIILELIQAVHPKFTSESQILSYCQYQFESEHTFLGVPWVGNWSDMGIYNSRIFGSNSPYNDALDALKSILLAFGCYGVFGLGNKFYVIPFFFSSAANQVNLLSLRKDQEPFVSPKIRGLRLKVFTGTVGSYQDYDYGEYEIIQASRHEDDSGDYYEFYHDIPAGDLPVSGAFTNLLIYVPDYVVGLGLGHWDLMRHNYCRLNSVSAWKSLYRVTGDAYWDLVSRNRYGHILKTPQTVEPYNTVKVYNSSDIYRVKLIEKSIENDNKVKIIECGI